MPLQEETEIGKLVRPRIGWLPDPSAGRLLVAVLTGLLLAFGAWAKEDTASFRKPKDGSASEPQTIVSPSAGRTNLLNQKLRLVEAMLERAQQRYSGVASATSQLEIAGMLTELARTDLGSGDLESAEPSLNEALRLLSELSRSAHVVSEEKLKARYLSLLEGVEALREAFTGVVAEKGDEARSALDVKDNDSLIKEAKHQADIGHYEKAAELLEVAHERTAIALSKVRANETLEHRLVFEGPVDEYLYERDRYQSSAILVRLMLEERKPKAKALKQVEMHVATAAALDAEASRHASLGDYASAIRKQEAAGRELTNALRKIGVLLP